MVKTQNMDKTERMAIKSCDVAVCMAKLIGTSCVT